MKNKSLIHLVTALLLIGLFSCKKIDLPSSEYKKLFGSWKVIEVYAGWTGSYSPVQDIVFEYDDRGRFKRYVDNQITVKTKYYFDTRTDSYETYDVIRYDDKEIMRTSAIWFGETGDTLNLTEECSDCASYLLVKQ